MAHRLRASASVVALAALLSCNDAPEPAPHRLIEKGPYQALYGPDGRLERLVYDPNGSRRAEAQILYAPSGRPLRAEVDTDGDGVVDRWEVFAADGTLEKVGISLGKTGRPDEWTLAEKSSAGVPDHRLTGEQEHP